MVPKYTAVAAVAEEHFHCCVELLECWTLVVLLFLLDVCKFAFEIFLSTCTSVFGFCSGREQSFCHHCD